MKVPEIPMVVVGALAVFGGLWFLTWHAYARDDADEQWLDPGQPPAMATLPLVPGAHGTGNPMSCNQGFRSRCYPDLLAEARLMLGGGD